MPKRWVRLRVPSPRICATASVVLSIEDRQRHAAEEREGRDMAVAERLGRLGRVRLDEERIPVRQRHGEEVQLAPDPAYLAERLAEVHLGVPGRMRQGHEHLLGPALLLPNVVGDDGDAAGEAVLVAQPLEDPLRRVPLLLRKGPVRLKDLVDDREERVELRAHRGLRSPVPRAAPSASGSSTPSCGRSRTAGPPLARSAHRHDTLAAHAHRVPQSTSPRLQLVRLRRRMADIYSAAVRASDRFRGPFCLRGSHPHPSFGY